MSFFEEEQEKRTGRGNKGKWIGKGDQNASTFTELTEKYFVPVKKKKKKNVSKRKNERRQSDRMQEGERKAINVNNEKKGGGGEGIMCETDCREGGRAH